MVVALEHRDGSGPRSFVNQPDGQEIKLDDEVDYSKAKFQDLEHSSQGMHHKYDFVVGDSLLFVHTSNTEFATGLHLPQR